MSRINEFGQEIGDAVAWSGARTPEARVFEGRGVRLEPLTAEHAAAVVEVLSPHPDLWTYQAENPPATPEEAAARIAVTTAAPDQLGFAIIDQASSAFLGRVCYLRIQPGLGSIEVGAIIYAPALQRTKAATEVQYLLLRHAFDDLGYRRYEWKCDSLNVPSRRAADRLGLVEEGTWRNALVTKGRNRDTTWYSITDAEWPATKAGLEAWLADDNFNADGVQLQPLAVLRDRLAGSAPA
jgi:RimJ/RimL family protein N-acetyltransferase